MLRISEHVVFPEALAGIDHLKAKVSQRTMLRGITGESEKLWVPGMLGGAIQYPPEPDPEG